MEGSETAVRTLCDGGSETIVITEKVAADRGLKLWPTGATIKGFLAPEGQTCKMTIMRLRLKGVNGTLKVRTYVVPKIEMILPKQEILDAEQPEGIVGELADPEFRVPGPVDMVLGSGVMAALIENESKYHNGYRWQKTQLGWLVYGGRLEFPIERELCVNMIEEEDERLESMLQRLWESDDIPKERMRTSEEERAERVFKDNVSRDETGRYVVKIPLRDQVKRLGSSRAAAYRRFLALEDKFKKDPELEAEYGKTMQEYLDNGYMKRTCRSPVGPVYYLPHHAVRKKFRVVFDASCLTDQGISLNECQLVGERLQEELFKTLVRFRTRRIAITADIKKMYLQVKIPEEQYDLQRVIWREKGKAIGEYWLTRVTFGMASAPHSAVRAMIQCAEDLAHKYPAAAEVIKRDFYMDDCLSGCESIEKAKELVMELKALLAEGGFPIGKWHSNMPEIIAAGSGADGEREFDWEDSTVLGLKWLIREDELSFQWKNREIMIPTKRGVTQDLGRVFDPLGFIGPVTAAGKIIFRRLSANKVSWDAVLPPIMLEAWTNWREDLGSLQGVRIPRWVDEKTIVAVHGFADASENAYGAVVYAEYITQHGSSMTLLASKSRVAPLRTRTIPRLELDAAKLLAKLLTTVIHASNLKDKPVFAWSDSMITLQWLKRENGLKTFVHNRVQRIKELSAGWTWGHIKSELNPADLLSRGASAKGFENNNLWWHGPDLKLNKENERPIQLDDEEKLSFEVEYRKDAGRELNCNVILEYKDDSLLQDLKNTSSFTRLVRKMCWVKLFIRNCKRGRRELKILPVEEHESRLRTIQFSESEETEAIHEWVRMEQLAAYEKEIEALKKTGKVSVSSRVVALVPFLDMNGLLRVGGRLQNGMWSFEVKHPLLLPGNGHLALLIARFVHWKMMHGTYQVMAGQIRRMFWITNLRRLCKATTSKCVVCIRYSNKPMGQLMGDLPAVRVTPGRAFEATGIDYAGPFDVKPDLPRSRVLLKKWVAVFVCMKSRQTHLELVDNLTSRAFVDAFIRFTSVRNPCFELWSDNATTFVGAEKQLKTMLKSWLQNDAEEDEVIKQLGVVWKHIAPRSPHQGGLWEAAVKAMKYHLMRVVGRHLLTSNEWRTHLARLSAVLNSRPVSATSDDPDDLDYITSNHLATGGPAIQLLGPRSSGMDGNREGLLNDLLMSFWRRWMTEVVMAKQERGKWRAKERNLAVGDLVIIMEDNLPPTVYKMGRVKEVLPGSDGLVRNVRLKTAASKSLVTRSVQKLILLLKHDN